MASNKTIGAVAVVGGTHGNELTGVYTVKHWQKNRLAQAYPQFQLEFLLANPPAMEANKRYLQKDLNRCFTLAELNDDNATNQEQMLAKKINQQLGPKSNARVDLIVDLHTSTANMQTNIVLIKMDQFHLNLAAYLKNQLSDVMITSESQLMSDHHFLCSIADRGIVIEVGPIAQGCLDSRVFDKTNLALKTVLDFVQKYNQNSLPVVAQHLSVMSYFSKLFFPQDERGEINACVHPDLIAQDYSRISRGTPIFKTFAGEDILYEGEDTHVAFVNEAAYYDQKIAMCLCNPVIYSTDTLQPILNEKSDKDSLR